MLCHLLDTETSVLKITKFNSESYGNSKDADEVTAKRKKQYKIPIFEITVAKN